MLLIIEETMPSQGMTTEEVEQYRTESGGWSKAALEQLGVNWPPVKGWKSRLIAGENPNIEADDAIFLRLADGRWGVRVTCRSREITPGMSISVRKRDGTSEVVRVVGVISKGTHYAYCTFY
jgi:hypothetical protein